MYHFLSKLSSLSLAGHCAGNLPVCCVDLSFGSEIVSHLGMVAADVSAKKCLIEYEWMCDEPLKVSGIDELQQQEKYGPGFEAWGHADLTL